MKLKSYPRWFIKRHLEYRRDTMCTSDWVEVWAFLDGDGNYVGPVGVCFKCGEIVEIEDELIEAGYPK
jgi:hypothetical protein